MTSVGSGETRAKQSEARQHGGGSLVRVARARCRPPYIHSEKRPGSFRKDRTTRRNSARAGEIGFVRRPGRKLGSFRQTAGSGCCRRHQPPPARWVRSGNACLPGTGEDCRTEHSQSGIGFVRGLRLDPGRARPSAAEPPGRRRVRSVGGRNWLRFVGRPGPESGSFRRTRPDRRRVWSLARCSNAGATNPNWYWVRSGNSASGPVVGASILSCLQNWVRFADRRAHADRVRSGAAEPIAPGLGRAGAPSHRHHRVARASGLTIPAGWRGLAGAEGAGGRGIAGRRGVTRPKRCHPFLPAPARRLTRKNAAGGLDRMRRVVRSRSMGRPLRRLATF
jgi:hypothetical protein